MVFHCAIIRVLNAELFKPLKLKKNPQKYGHIERMGSSLFKCWFR